MTSKQKLPPLSVKQIRMVARLNTMEKSKLRQIALNKENVHTDEVMNLMCDGMKKLISQTSVPDGQDTLAEIETAWSDKTTDMRKKVMSNIRMWYDSDKKSYRPMLDGLWVLVKGNKQLIQRLWEEAYESIDLCWLGQLGRLANVMVGFIDEVKPHVPVGEILQQKMSAIASKDIGLEFKVCEAWAVFEELNIPMEDRDVWLQAL